MKKKNTFLLLVLVFSNLSLTPLKSDTILELGKEVFINKGMCSTCHTLSDAKSNGEIGPNLDMIKPGKERVISVVTNGIGIMPSYQNELTKKEIEAVAQYVFESSNQ